MTADALRLLNFFMCKNADIETQDAEMRDPSEQSTEADIEMQDPTEQRYFIIIYIYMKD